MTLLEIMLALTLTAFVLATISMAIDLNLRMLDSRRGDVERIQVARAVLQMIANDLRATVQPVETDFSALSAMASEAAGDAAAALGLDGATTGGDDQGTGGETGGEMPAPDTAADSSADQGFSDDTADASSAATTDIATDETPPPVPGLYGNQYQLQMDVCRLPRVDQMQQLVTDSRMGMLQDIPSDVKTVAYYLHDPENGLVAGDFRDRAGNPQSGLVRRALDRAVTLCASQSNTSTTLQNTGEIIATEVVALQFEYFDGSQWLYEWDSDELGGLPVAVRITIALAPEPSLRDKTNASTITRSASEMVTDQTFTLTVRLPTALPMESDTTADSGLESVGL
jgi:hypothetical protein